MYQGKARWDKIFLRRETRENSRIPIISSLVGVKYQDILSKLGGKKRIVAVVSKITNKTKIKAKRKHYRRWEGITDMSKSLSSSQEVPTICLNLSNQ